MTEQKCGNKASHRFTWPGEDESFICGEHVPKLRAVADALGMHLQTIPLPDDTEETCQQAVPVYRAQNGSDDT